MPLLLPHYSPLLLLSLATVCILSCASSLASPMHHHHHEVERPKHDDHHQKRFRFSLRRVDSSNNNLTIYERVWRAAERSQHRYQILTSRQKTTAAGYVVTQVQRGNSEFMMDIAIGTPPLFYIALLDTGSDLVWTQCQPCQQCLQQSTPIFNPSNSSSYSSLSCSSDRCHDLGPSSSCSDDNICRYNYGYAAGLSLDGFMGTETFIFGDFASPTIVPSLAFGCAINNTGPLSGNGEAGIVGLGNGPLSLNWQLQVGAFAYCLVGLTSKSSSNLLMGWYPDQYPVPIVQTTPMITDSRVPFYYMRLNGINVGGAQVPIPDGAFSRGTIIDSGTTYSHLPSTVVAAIGDVISQLANLPRLSDVPGFPVCFQMNNLQIGVQLPNMVMRFENMDLELDGERLWVSPASDVVCLAIQMGDDISILGNVQQTNMQVVYDIGNGALGFTPTNCDGY